MSPVRHRFVSSPQARLALCLMLGAWPLVTVLLAVLGPFTADWPLALRTLVVVPPMVTGMVFAIIPLVQRFAGGWIAAGAVRAETA